MKLTDLEPQFYRYDQRPDGLWRVPVQTLAEAQCIHFVCPKCLAERGERPGVHGVEVTFANRGVLAGQGIHNSKGEDVRWQVSGTGYDDLTTQPSILIEGGCAWHGFITNGQIV